MQNLHDMKQIRQKAVEILDKKGLQNRLHLVLGLFVALALGLSVPVLLDCFWLVGAILGGQTALWTRVIYEVLFWGSLVGILLPLLAGVYRMAILMVERSQTLCPDTLMPPKVGVFEVLYPFTSGKAYLRCLLAGLQGAIRWGGLWLLPWLASFLGELWLPMLAEVPAISSFVSSGQTILIVVGWFFLGCRHHGYAYLLLACPDLPMAHINRKYRSTPRPFGQSLAMAWDGLWRVVASGIFVLVPLFLHTLPCLMLTWAQRDRQKFD